MPSARDQYHSLALVIVFIFFFFNQFYCIFFTIHKVLSKIRPEYPDTKRSTDNKKGNYKEPPGSFYI